MAVVSVKVPEEIKEKMRAYSDVVKWPEIIRESIIKKIEEVERGKAVEKVIRLLEPIAPAPKGTAKVLVREDRNSH